MTNTDYKRVVDAYIKRFDKLLNSYIDNLPNYTDDLYISIYKEFLILLEKYYPLLAATSKGNNFSNKYLNEFLGELDLLQSKVSNGSIGIKNVDNFVNDITKGVINVSELVNDLNNDLQGAKLNATELNNSKRKIGQIVSVQMRSVIAKDMFSVFKNTVFAATLTSQSLAEVKGTLKNLYAQKDSTAAKRVERYETQLLRDSFYQSERLTNKFIKDKYDFNTMLFLGVRDANNSQACAYIIDTKKRVVKESELPSLINKLRTDSKLKKGVYKDLSVKNFVIRSTHPSCRHRIFWTDNNNIQLINFINNGE